MKSVFDNILVKAYYYMNSRVKNGLCIRYVSYNWLIQGISVTVISILLGIFVFKSGLIILPQNLHKSYVKSMTLI